MFELRKMIVDIIGKKVEDSWKDGVAGICSFCGRHLDVSASSVVEVLNRDNHPGNVNFYLSSLPKICHDCSIVYENITKKNLSEFFAEKKLFVVDIQTQEYEYIDHIDQLRGRENISVWYKYEGSKHMPTNCYIRQITVDTEKGIWINAINGSKLYPVFLGQIDENKSRDFILNSVKQYLLGGKKSGKGKSSSKKKTG